MWPLHQFCARVGNIVSAAFWLWLVTITITYADRVVVGGQLRPQNLEA